jgi:hypothetical protein
VASDAALLWFGDDGKAQENFAEFMSNGDMSPFDSGFTEEIEFPCHPTDPSKPRPSVEELLRLQPGASGIAMAYHQHGYSLEQIAAVLGRSRSAVGRELVAFDSEQMLDSAT